MKKLLIAIIILTVFIQDIAMAEGADKKSKFLTYDVTISTQHLWRGFKSGTTPCLEPSIALHFTPNLTFGIWGGTTYDDSYREVDLYLSYQYKPLKITVLDYYDPAINTFYWEDVTNYDRKTTEHLLDVVVDYQFENNPFRLMASTIFYGNDRDEDGNQNYSTYFEVGYGLPYQSILTDFFIGVNPIGTFYYDKFSVVNLGVKATKDVKISEKYHIPITVNLSGNPAKEQLYFSVIMSVF